MRFQLLMVAGRKMTVFWDIALCSIVEVDGHFRGAYCLRRLLSSLEIPDLSSSKYGCLLIHEIQ
jgi:hypothetical protein